MIDLRLAKSMMENEEGMNHLWIRLLDDEKVKIQGYELYIQLPIGIYRSYNLNGFAENEQEHVVVDALDEDVVIEIFTQDAIQCGETTIIVHLCSANITISKEISFLLVKEDEMDTVEIDEQVIERIKALDNAAPSYDEGAFIEFIQPKILKKSANEFSHLEKQYRIDY